VGLHLLRDLVADGEDRVQARERLLEDHRHVIAPERAHVVFGDAEDLAAVEPDLAADDLGRRDVEEPHDRERRDALAACGLADEAHGPAPRHGEAHAVHGLHRAVHDVEMGL
jgi:hypothetical protein